VFYESENKAIKLACRTAEKNMERSLVSFEESKKVNISAWWEREPYDDYCVDIHSGKIILEHLDENYKAGIKESIGEFRCYYFYKYDPQGEYLDVLDNADAISGDLCLAIETLKGSKKWEDVYDTNLSTYCKLVLGNRSLPFSELCSMSSSSLMLICLLHLHNIHRQSCKCKCQIL
jgi:hypothetical protein